MAKFWTFGWDWTAFQAHVLILLLDGQVLDQPQKYVEKAAADVLILLLDGQVLDRRAMVGKYVPVLS